MHRYAVAVWNRIPTVLSFVLLAIQLAIPWSVRNFITQDGPSHLYGAVVLRGLLFHHATSIYSPFYTIQRAAIPNWTSTIVLAILSAIAGPEYAEKLFATVALAAGFFAFHFAIRELDPEAPRWSPIANFVLQVWFLWVGFYNFYLGMMLMPLAVGFAARRGLFSWKRCAGLAAIFVLLFLTHPAALITAIVAVTCIAFWRAFKQSHRLRILMFYGLAMAPAILLTAIYARNSAPPGAYALHVLDAWQRFPMHIFATASLDTRPTVKILLAWIAVAAVFMRKSDWTSVRGALAMATVLIFLVYLFIPNEGFGGSDVTVRFAWATCLLGALFACSARRLRWVHPVAALCIAWSMGPNLLATHRTAEFASRAADDYLAAANQIPAKASFVRVQYARPDLPVRFGYARAGRDPLFHLDAWVAVRRHAVDLSDYEPLSGVFPVITKIAAIDLGKRSVLHGFEGADPGSPAAVPWLDTNLPRRIDYVLLVGEEQAPAAIREGMPAMLDFLHIHATQVAQSRSEVVRLYQLDHPVPN